jgi:hypothetical protein
MLSRVRFSIRRFSSLLETEFSKESPTETKTKQELIEQIKQQLFKIPSEVTALAKDKRAVAVEVDGPSHFYVNSHEYTAYSKMKKRILEKMGLVVVNVPYFEWNKLTNSDGRQKYLVKKIDAALLKTEKTSE